MLGLVPNLLEKLVETVADADAVAEVKRRAGIPLERKYALNSLCPDEEWRRLYSAACDVLGLSVEEAERAYADFFLRDGLTRWPEWFEMAANSREFLQRQPAIHNTFAMSVHDPDTRQTINDKFRVHVNNGELITYYSSPNRHCGLYKELARWIVDYYGDSARIDEPRCIKRGDDQCEIHICWDNNGAKLSRDNGKH